MQAWDALKRPIWMFDPVALRGVYANAAALDGLMDEKAYDAFVKSLG